MLGVKDGALSLLQETTLVIKEGVKIGAADIHLSSDQRFLYATNRGTANDISCFSISDKGLLTFEQQIATGGDGPRNFALTPDGEFVFVAHQYSDNIVILKRDASTGFLSDTGKRINTGAPVCLIFY